MAWLRKTQAEVAIPTRELADAQVAPWVEELARPCARIDLGPPAQSPLSSCIGGVPYLPVGTPWPTVDGRSAVFVCQVNFAEVPPLPGFPTAGLLQWFVGPDASFGLDDDDDAELGPVPAGRWHPAPFPAESRAVDDGAKLPFAIAPGAGMVFTAGRTLPSWDDLPADVRQLPLWSAVAAAYGDKKAGALRGYMGVVRDGGTDHDFELTDASTVGGFVTDPPSSGTDGTQPIVALDFGHLSDYADLDADCAGELWGDPGALRTGDLSQLRQRWF